VGEGYVEVGVVGTIETAEALADFLFTEGALGLVTEDRSDGSAVILIRASFPRTLSVERIVARLADYQRELEALGLAGGDGHIEVRTIPSEDWGRSWKQHFRPLVIGRRLVIAPPWEAGPFPEDRLVVRIDPGMSFGTGHHATTRMCLEALEAFLDQWRGDAGPRVLDVGTGTGILAMAADALGAERVVAVDTDPEACAGAMKNLASEPYQGLCPGPARGGRSPQARDAIRPGRREPRFEEPPPALQCPQGSPGPTRPPGRFRDLTRRRGNAQWCRQGCRTSLNCPSVRRRVALPHPHPGGG